MALLPLPAALTVRDRALVRQLASVLLVGHAVRCKAFTNSRPDNGAGSFRPSRS